MAVPLSTFLHVSSTNTSQEIAHSFSENDLNTKEQPRPTIYVAIITRRDGSIKTKCLNPNAVSAQAHTRGRKRPFSSSSQFQNPLSSSKMSLVSLPKKSRLLMFWPKRTEAHQVVVARSIMEDVGNEHTTELLRILPVEVINCVLAHLDHISLLRLGQTSHSIHALCHNSRVWYKLFRQDFHNLSSSHRSHDFEKLYQDRVVLDRRWKAGNAQVHYLDDSEGHHDSIYSLTWIDHRTIISTSRDRTIKVWDIFTRQCIATQESPHEGSILCVATTPGGYAVTGSSDGSCVVWSLQPDYKPLQRYTEHHGENVLSVVFVTEDKVVTASRDTTLCIWKVSTGETLRVFRGHTDAVNAVKVLDDRRVISASSDGTMRVWCTETGECLQTLTSQIGGLSCLQVVERGRRIWACGMRNQIQMWILREDSVVRTMTTNSGHTDLIRSLDSSEDRVVTVGYDKVIKVWDTRACKCAINFQSGHEGRIFSVLMGRTVIVSAGHDRRIMVLDFGKGLSLDLSK